MIKLIDRIPVCPHSKREDIDQFLVLSLERLEREVKIPLEFSSGYRCRACNVAAGGSKNSAHMRGLAVDISVSSSGFRFRIISLALLLLFRRIGIGQTFIHLDVDTTLPQDVLWLY